SPRWPRSCRTTAAPLSPSRLCHGASSHPSHQGVTAPHALTSSRGSCRPCNRHPLRYNTHPSSVRVHPCHLSSSLPPTISPTNTSYVVITIVSLFYFHYTTIPANKKHHQ